ncbi:hypothetical protein [Streptomyces sp. GbtcB6]|uniref:hypothetical protein n=1 Tax=Streptomyces sp. GbtcB6 TaxID=2824751 RepID=UPI001C301B17|nr:hypothetical protein [Streptomyces sp. GbtcB6]
MEELSLPTLVAVVEDAEFPRVGQEFRINEPTGEVRSLQRRQADLRLPPRP